MTECPEYLQNQLITYIGNKRSLLPFIGQAIRLIQKDLGREKLSFLDLFAGSGIVARYLKQFSSSLTVNDMEQYSAVISRCYLSDLSQTELVKLQGLYNTILKKTSAALRELCVSQACGGSENYIRYAQKGTGFISELYAPDDIENIKKTDRCFYTPYNAAYIDICRQLISSEAPDELRDFFIAPLLSEASIHANTAGIFKGFYKNSATGTGQFGGNGKNALSRITGRIELPFPVFSSFSCPHKVFMQEANSLVLSRELYELCGGQFDVAYFDPPYNQHPYGSNYFMLNLIAAYERPDLESISRVSGIPRSWNRSVYNKRRQAAQSFFELASAVNAKYILVSFNSEGFIPREQMIQMLSSLGDVRVLEATYNAFRGSRNLGGRELHVKEYLFLLKRT